MAEYFVGTQRFVVSPELWTARLSKETLIELQNDLRGLIELEQCRDLGIIRCSDHDWQEIVEVAKKTAFEIGWRSLRGECGITLEVR